MQVSGVAALLNGGDGNDVLEANVANAEDFVYDPELDDYVLVVQPGSATLQGGDGDDDITLLGVANATGVIDAAAGADRIVVLGQADVTVTTGDGSDTLVLPSSGYSGTALEVTDFTPGAGGDRLDVTAVLNVLAQNGWGGGNPFADGSLSLVQTGADAVLRMDTDGSDPATDPVDLVLFRNVDIGDFGPENFLPAMDPAGTLAPGLTLIGGADDNLLSGGLGADTLEGGDGQDSLYGSFGDDSLSGGADADALYGGAGGDTLSGGLGGDTLDGGVGNDMLSGEAGDDILYGGAGGDTLSGDDGDDVLDGGAGNDLLLGEAGNDVLTATTSAGDHDTLSGATGDDSLDGMVNGGVLSMSGDGGNDTLTVSAEANYTEIYDPVSETYEYFYIGGDVTMVGGAGDDSIRADVYEGSAEIEAGTGNDTISVNLHQEITVITGDGQDVITLRSIFGSGNPGLVITDFSAGPGGDRIDLGPTLGALANYGWQSGNPFAGGYLRLVQDGANVVLRADRDGDAGSDWSAFDLVTFTGVDLGDFTADNFIPAFEPGGAPIPGIELTGTAADDTLSGSWGNDTLSGGDGDDWLEGSFDDDSLAGEAGDDYLYGGGGNDVLTGGDGNDELSGGAGSDLLQGGAGNDRLTFETVSDDGTESDTVSGGEGDDQFQGYNYGGLLHLSGDGGNDIIEVTVSTENNPAVSTTLYGGAGDDLIGADIYGGAVQIDAGTGNDTISATATRQVAITTGAGQDVIILRGLSPFEDNLLEVTDFTTGPGGDRVDLAPALDAAVNAGWIGENPFGDGILTLVQDGADVVLMLDADGADGFYEPIRLVTFRNVDVNDFTRENFTPPFPPDGSAPEGLLVTGTAGDDTLAASPFGDTLQGGDGDDVLIGGAGDDLLQGGAGADSLTGSDADTLEGGTGDDTAILDSGAAGAVVDLGAGDDNVVLDLGGSASVTTGSGRDQIALSGTIGAGGALVVTDFVAGAGGDQIDLGELMSALTWDTGASYISELLAGGQLILVQDGADTVLRADFVDYEGGPVTADLLRLEGVTAADMVPDNFLPSSPLVLEGGTGNDSLTGGEGDDSLYGMDGDDTLDGQGGNDWLEGGAGRDILSGGEGSDYLRGGDGNDLVSGNEGYDFLYGGGGDDTLEGGLGDDQIYGGDGDDSLSGGAGNDEMRFDGEFGDNATLSGGDGDDSITVWAYADQIETIDPLTGQQVFMSLGGDVTASGGAGNDLIQVSSYGGTAQVDAGSGDDVIFVRHTQDVILTMGTGSDVVNLQGWTNEGGSEHPVVTDFTTGAGGDQIELFAILEGLEGMYAWTDGNPFADGILALVQAGADTLLRVTVDGVSHTVITLQNTLASAFTSANFAPAFDPGGAPFPSVSLVGDADDNVLLGSYGDDTIFGGAGDDDINGSYGSDSLSGGAGSDYVYGGSGRDTIAGDDGNDQIYGGSGDDDLSGGEGDDHLAGGPGSDTMSGGNGNDSLTSHGAGNDSLSGGAGDDDLYVDGGVGNNATLSGGDGDDIIFGEGEAGDSYVIDPVTGEGEWVELGGVLTIFGGAGNDDITARAYYAGQGSTVDAGSGNDTIRVRAVDDMVVTTGSGSDLIEVTQAAIGFDNGLDVTDFTTGANGDRLDLLQILAHLDEAGAWLGSNPFGTGALSLVQVGADTLLRGTVDGTAFTIATLRNTVATACSAANFVPGYDPGGTPFPGVSLSGSAADDQLTGGAGNDTLSAADGADTLTGGFGDDQLSGGEGDDYLYGEAGRDTLSGGDGADLLSGGSGDDSLAGGAGDDLLYGGGGNDQLSGDDGHDDLQTMGEVGDDVTLSGGAGNDTIYAHTTADERYVVDPVTGQSNWQYFGGDQTLLGGAGDDDIRSQISGGAGIIDAGAGDDVIRVHAQSSTEITTGTGSDLIVLENWVAWDDNNLSVTDFTAGAGGDRLDIHRLLQQMEDEPGWTAANPFVSGGLSLVQSGADTLVQAIANGESFTVVTLHNTLATALTAANFEPPLTPVVRENAAPVLQIAMPDQTFAEDGGPFEIDLPTGMFTDADTADLTLTAHQANGAALPGWLLFDAESGSFSGTPPAHYNGTLTLRVTASDGVRSAYDDFVLTVTPVNDAPTGGISLSGTARQGQVLTAVTSSLADADGLGTLSYQWLRNGAVITGATGSTLTLGQAHVGAAISVRVSYTDAQGTAEVVTSGASTAVQNVNDVPTGGISLSGTARQGQVLTAVTSSLADADGLGTLSYQWLRNGAVITGATGSTLTLGQAHVGAAISVRVSYTDAQGTAEVVTSGASTAVQNVNDVPTGGISLSGTARQGQVLTAVTSSLADADGLGTLSYQWLRNGAVITGATGSTLTLGQAHVGAAISVRVSYTDAQGTAEVVTSGASAQVASSAPVPTAGHDRLTGTAAANTINGLAGNDTISGLGGNDSLLGGAGADQLLGGAGADTLSGGAGNDSLTGDAGNDRLLGGAGNDNLAGDGGNDRLSGDGGSDLLSGGAGADTLTGGAGADTLNGGAGADVMTGDAGADTFVFTGGRDRITDLTAGQRDRLELSSDLWSGTLSEAQVVARFGRVVSGDVVLNFGGGDVLVIEDIARLAAVTAMIDIV